MSPLGWTGFLAALALVGLIVMVLRDESADTDDKLFLGCMAGWTAFALLIFTYVVEVTR